ncbi:MAG: hypothetical protein ACHREM_33840, partial [Polyangiales bacterium]
MFLDSLPESNANSAAPDLASHPHVQPYVARVAISDARETAKHRAREAEHWVRSGAVDFAIDRLERGLDGLVGDADPELSAQLGDRLEAFLEREGRLEDLANRAANRGRNERDDARAIVHLKRSATIRKDKLADVEGARALRIEILARVEDSDTLHAVVDDARERGDHAEALDHLRRLEKIATTDRDRVKIALAEAALLADPIGDVAGALAKYRDVLAKDDHCLPAWRAVAELEAKGSNTSEAAKALTAALALAETAEEKAEVGRALGVAEESLGNVAAAIDAYEAVVAADEGDFDATGKLRALCEQAGRWTRVVELLDAQIEAEVDEDEIAVLEARKAEVVADELDKPEDALRGLASFSAGGSAVARKTAIAIADRHGADAQLGGQLLAWSRGSKGPEAQRLLGEAFDRFVRGDQSDRALEIAPELLRTPKAKDDKFLEGLEAIAISAKSVELVLEAHDRRAAIAA